MVLFCLANGVCSYLKELIWGVPCLMCSSGPLRPERKYQGLSKAGSSTSDGMMGS